VIRPFFLVALSGAALLSAGQGENLLQNGSFELPKVAERTSADKGGDPALGGAETGWEAFAGPTNTTGGKLVVGLTDQIARTGKQSIFIDFQKLTDRGQLATLESKFIPIKASQDYRISIWGRIDRDRPLSLDERRPSMWLHAMFFGPDKKTQVAEPQSSVILIPGSVVPGKRIQLFYTSEKWTETTVTVKAPEGAVFLAATWMWVVGSDAGETDGVIYWDDVTVEEQPAESAAPEKSKETDAKSAPATTAPSAERKTTP
jgi:hypothetical protein